MARLVESLAGASILLLTTYRPGYRPPWLEKFYATQLSLRNLTAGDALTVVQSVSQGETLPDHVSQTIIDKAEGNAFFLEELTRALLEHDEGRDELAVPDTIQGVLMARIDRLPEAPKRLLQTASVLGREFSPRLLKAIWQHESPLEPLLFKLKRLEFVYERSGVDEPLYVFKHALTQDVAYETLLTTRRQALHLAAAQALETLYAERLEEVYERLAHHYAMTDETAKAVAYLTPVAQRAADSFAHREAIAILDEALLHAERLPTAERAYHVVDLWRRQIESRFYAGQRQEAIACHLAQRERLDQFQDHALVGQYYVWLGAHYSYLGERERAIQSGHRALEEGQQCDDALTMMYDTQIRRKRHTGRSDRNRVAGLVLLDAAPSGRLEQWA